MILIRVSRLAPAGAIVHCPAGATTLKRRMNITPEAIGAIVWQFLWLYSGSVWSRFQYAFTYKVSINAQKDRVRHYRSEANALQTGLAHGPKPWVQLLRRLHTSKHWRMVTNRSTAKIWTHTLCPLKGVKEPTRLANALGRVSKCKRTISGLRARRKLFAAKKVTSKTQ